MPYIRAVLMIKLVTVEPTSICLSSIEAGRMSGNRIESNRIESSNQSSNGERAEHRGRSIAVGACEASNAKAKAKEFSII